MIVVLVGAPGSGKGTQCKRLAEKFELFHLSSGDIFRSEISNKTPLGVMAKAFIDKGNLVPDNLVIDIMKKAVADTKFNCILDGFPRTLAQAQQLDDALLKSNAKIDAVIELRVDDDVVADRISKRRVCLECGAVYHLETLLPKAEGICDTCGKQLIQRADDKQEVIIDRLKTYHSLTEPVLHYYRDNVDSFFEVDANLSIDEITSTIVKDIKAVL